MKLRATLMRALAALVATLVMLAAAEGFLRVFAPQFRVMSAGFYQNDPRRGYRLKAGYRGEALWGRDIRYHIAVNGLSQRDGELDAQADCRVLAIGDSHTFGPGVEQRDTYPARLETLLAERSDRRIEVVNAGVPAYGWLEESETLRDLLAGGFRADLVLFQTSWNDINNNAMGIPKYLIDRKGRLIAQVHHQRPGGFGEWGMKTGPIGQLELAALRHSQVATLLIGGWRGAWYRLRREQLEREIARYKWQASDTALATISDQVRAFGIDMLAVVHPGSQPEQLEMHRATTDRLISMLRRRDVSFVDLRAPLRTHEDPPGLYIPGDEHFNARGYDWMARQLLEPVLARLEASPSRCRPAALSRSSP